jgi:hypothetical protein
VDGMVSDINDMRVHPVVKADAALLAMTTQTRQRTKKENMSNITTGG